MNFLVPAAWWFSLLAIPVIIFYLIKTRVPRQRVSTLIFWGQTPLSVHQSSIWLKLRRWLSLLLQLLFLFLLVWALTQPLPKGASLQPRNMVIILDSTLSMSAREGEASRWEKSLDAARGVVRSMGMQDSTAVIQADQSPKILSGWNASRHALLKVLKDAQPSNAIASPESAIRLASELLSDRSHPQIILISDGVWGGEEKIPATPNLRLLQIGESRPNAGLMSFAARRSPVAPTQVIVSAKIRSFLDQPAKGEVELQQNGRTIDLQEVLLDPGQEWTREWTMEDANASRFEIKLAKFPPDALLADDSATCSVGAAKSIHAVLVSPQNTFLEAALSAMPLLEWKRIAPSELPRFPASDSVYIFNEISPPEAYVSVPQILINPPASGTWGTREGSLESPLVSEVLRDSPLLMHANFMMVALDNAGKWKAAPGSETWVSSFDDPLIFGNWKNERKRLVMAFGLGQSDLALRTAFPVFLANLFDSLRVGENEKAGTYLDESESSLKGRENALSLPKAENTGSALLSRFPLWWWIVLAGVMWLAGEWWSYTRRITE